MGTGVSEIAACLLIVLVGCLGWLWAYEQIGFMNMLSKQNSFICMGLTAPLTILFNMELEGETDTTAVSEGNPCSEHCEEWADWWLIQRCENQAAGNCGRLYHRSWLWGQRRVTYLTLLSNEEMRCLWKTLNLHVQAEEINFLGITNIYG